MTLYVHIGLNKTGTSSIQKFFADNQQVLERLGVVYPTIGLHDSAHYGFSKQLMGLPAAANVSLADGIEEVIGKAAEKKQTVVISSEYLFLAKEEQVLEIKRFLENTGVDIKIVIYLRRHDSWVDSLFNQAVKTAPGNQGWDLDIREYFIYLLGASEFEIRYPRIIAKWANAFGQGNIIVRPFEKSQFYKDDLIWDFCRVIDADLPAALEKQGVSTVQVNESVPDDLIKVIGAIRRLNIPPDQKNAVSAQLLRARRVGQPRAPRGDEKPVRIPQHLRKHIVNFFQDDYQQIARTYLGAEDGVLFTEKPTPPPAKP
ncbi:MAG TPA: hypothetical protein VEN78_20955 [Bradyrhizobium sp.]|nr:hypothetical protein [Bradyrhizobium sp.]